MGGLVFVLANERVAFVRGEERKERKRESKERGKGLN